MRWPKRVLAIGSHPDDVELYAGGTLLRLVDEGAEIYHLVCTRGRGKKGNRTRENGQACRFLGVKEDYLLGFRDSRLGHSRKLISAIDDTIGTVRPDWIFTHTVADHHQDHIAVARATISANRWQRATLITYPSYNPAIPFNANLFVDVSDYFDKKLELLKIFKSQQDEWYFRPEIVKARSQGTNIAKYVERFRVEMMRL